MKMFKLFSRKNCAIITLFNVLFVGAIVVSFNKTNRANKLKNSIQQIATSFHANDQNVLISSAFSGSKKPGEVFILFWTQYFGTDDPSETLLKSPPNCFANCRIVTDRKFLGVSEAVVFHSRDLSKNDLPTLHLQSQVWVYLQQESPMYTSEDLLQYSGIFNWTMTYRRDSDVYHPYNRVLQQEAHLPALTESSSNYSEIFKEKTRLVAWVVSNCHTKGQREQYVTDLEKYITIDIYGDCGDYTCSRHGDACLSMINQKYKFYLSFENSLCTDYITEKFFNALQYNLVPVVFGGANYDTVAPPGSYINAMDFKSPKALADYLLKLEGNRDKYLQYFLWKSKYKISPGDGWCSLCEKVLQQKSKPTFKVYSNLHNWWHNVYNVGKSTDDHVSDPIDMKNSADVVSACINASTVNSTNIDFLQSISHNLKHISRWFRLSTSG